MSQPSICTVAILVLTASASAQRSELRTFQRIEGPIKDAGVLHVASGTWTRHNGTASLGGGASSIIYNCTSHSGYFGAMDPMQVFTASGRIPSTTSPASVWNPIAAPAGSAVGSNVGCQDYYAVDGYQISYCSDAPAASTKLTINFYEQYTTVSVVCFNPVNTSPQATHVYTNLPGDPTPGGNQCWIMTFDLTGAGSPNAPFAMLADGDGSYLDNTSDAFGWSFTFPSITINTAQTGMMLAGCPSDISGPVHPSIGWKEFPPSTTVEAAGYDGTRFDGPPGALAPTFPANGVVGLPNPGGEDGSDMLGDDSLRIEGGASFPGCFFFGGPGGGPYSNFHLELYAGVACGAPQAGVAYCAGDNLSPSVTTICPCANFGSLGRGCASSFNTAGARLSSSGSLATGVVLRGEGLNLTIGAACIFLKGDADVPSAVVFGDGLRCAAGNLIRMKNQRITPHALPLGGTSQFPGPTDPPLQIAGSTPPGSGLTGYYTVYYRNAAAAFCPPLTFNATNGYMITW